MWENLSVDISLALIIDKKIKELALLSDILGIKPRHLIVAIFCITVWCFQITKIIIKITEYDILECDGTKSKP